MASSIYPKSFVHNGTLDFVLVESELKDKDNNEIKQIFDSIHDEIEHKIPRELRDASYINLRFLANSFSPNASKIFRKVFGLGRQKKRRFIDRRQKLLARWGTPPIIDQKDPRTPLLPYCEKHLMDLMEIEKGQGLQREIYFTCFWSWSEGEHSHLNLNIASLKNTNIYDPKKIEMKSQSFPIDVDGNLIYREQRHYSPDDLMHKLIEEALDDVKNISDTNSFNRLQSLLQPLPSTKIQEYNQKNSKADKVLKLLRTCDSLYEFERIIVSRIKEISKIPKKELYIAALAHEDDPESYLSVFLNRGLLTGERIDWSPFFIIDNDLPPLFPLTDKTFACLLSHKNEFKYFAGDNIVRYALEFSTIDPSFLERALPTSLSYFLLEDGYRLLKNVNRDYILKMAEHYGISHFVSVVHSALWKESFKNRELFFKEVFRNLPFNKFEFFESLSQVLLDFRHPLKEQAAQLLLESARENCAIDQSSIFTHHLMRFGLEYNFPSFVEYGYAHQADWQSHLDAQLHTAGTPLDEGAFTLLCLAIQNDDYPIEALPNPITSKKLWKLAVRTGNQEHAVFLIKNRIVRVDEVIREIKFFPVEILKTIAEDLKRAGLDISIYIDNFPLETLNFLQQMGVISVQELCQGLLDSLYKMDNKYPKLYQDELSNIRKTVASLKGMSLPDNSLVLFIKSCISREDPSSEYLCHIVSMLKELNSPEALDYFLGWYYDRAQQHLFLYDLNERAFHTEFVNLIADIGTNDQLIGLLNYHYKINDQKNSRGVNFINKKVLERCGEQFFELDILSDDAHFDDVFSALSSFPDRQVFESFHKKNPRVFEIFIRYFITRADSLYFLLTLPDVEHWGFLNENYEHQRELITNLMEAYPFSVDMLERIYRVYPDLVLNFRVKNLINHEFLSKLLSSDYIRGDLLQNDPEFFTNRKRLPAQLLKYPFLDHALKLKDNFESQFFYKLFGIADLTLPPDKLKKRIKIQLAKMFMLNSMKDIDTALAMVLHDETPEKICKIIIDEISRLKSIGGLVARSREMAFFLEIQVAYMNINPQWGFISFDKFALRQVSYAEGRYNAIMEAKKYSGYFLDFYRQLHKRDYLSTLLTPPILTPLSIGLLNSRYLKFEKYIEETLHSSINTEEVSVDDQETITFYHPRMGPNIPLTTIRKGKKGDQVAAANVKAQGDFRVFHHTPLPSQIKGLPYLIDLYNKLENYDFNQGSLEEFTELLIEYSYLAPNMVFVSRGNAQLVLDIVYHFLDKHHLEMGPPTVDCTFIDCVAMSVPYSRYREIFPTLVEYMPHYRSETLIATSNFPK